MRALTFGSTALAAFIAPAERVQVSAIRQRAVSIVAACAARGHQLEQVLLWHEAAWESATT